MKYVFVEINDEGYKIYARIDDDGLCRVTCTEDNPEYQIWLSKQHLTENPTE